MVSEVKGQHKWRGGPASCCQDFGFDPGKDESQWGLERKKGVARIPQAAVERADWGWRGRGIHLPGLM